MLSKIKELVPNTLTHVFIQPVIPLSSRKELMEQHAIQVGEKGCNKFIY